MLIKVGVYFLFGFFFFGGFSSAYGQDVLQLIREIDEKQQKIQTLVADFSQVKETFLAKEPLLSSGVVKFKRPDRIHFISSKPESGEIAIDGKAIWLYSPGQTQAVKFSLARNSRMVQYLEPLTGIFQKTLGRLAESYDLHYQGVEMGRLYRFRLQPREEKTQRFLSRVDLWIDKDSGAILRFEMIEANKDRLNLEFKNLQVNPALTDGDLNIIIPPSVKVLEQIAP